MDDCRPRFSENERAFKDCGRGINYLDCRRCTNYNNCVNSCASIFDSKIINKFIALSPGMNYDPKVACRRDIESGNGDNWKKIVRAYSFNYSDVYLWPRSHVRHR